MTPYYKGNEDTAFLLPPDIFHTEKSFFSKNGCAFKKSP